MVTIQNKINVFIELSSLARSWAFYSFALSFLNDFKLLNCHI